MELNAKNFTVRFHAHVAGATVRVVLKATSEDWQGALRKVRDQYPDANFTGAVVTEV